MGDGDFANHFLPRQVMSARQGFIGKLHWIVDLDDGFAVGYEAVDHLVWAYLFGPLSRGWQRRRYPREALTLWNSRSDSPLATSVFASSMPTYR